MTKIVTNLNDESKKDNIKIPLFALLDLMPNSDKRLRSASWDFHGTNPRQVSIKLKFYDISQYSNRVPNPLNYINKNRNFQITRIPHQRTQTELARAVKI